MDADLRSFLGTVAGCYYASGQCLSPVLFVLSSLETLPPPPLPPEVNLDTVVTFYKQNHNYGL